MSMLIIYARVFYIRNYAQLALAQQSKGGDIQIDSIPICIKIKVYNIKAVEGLGRGTEQRALGVGQIVAGNGLRESPKGFVRAGQLEMCIPGTGN